MMQDLDHKHVLVTAAVRKPPQTIEQMNAWLLDTVKAVDMKVLMGPYTMRCETAGNVGITGVVVIETSHVTAHCWEEAPTPFINIDLYSCKAFDPNDVVETIKRHFDPYYVRVMFIDRNDPEAKIINQYEQVIHNI